MSIETESQQEFTLKIDNYSYRHTPDSQWVLRNINLTVAPGETLAVFGPTASGKTTLFQSALGFNNHFFRGGVHEGSINLQGKAVSDSDLSTHLRDCGLVSQGFRDQMVAGSVENAVAFPLENQAMPLEEMQARVQQILDQLAIPHLADKSVEELSGGEGQLVVIGEMLAKNPGVMVFDDISSDLDRRGQERILEIIEDLKRQGVTVLITDSSASNWLLQVADKALVLNEGHQEYFGTPKDILSNSSLMEKIGAVTPQIKFREPANSPSAVSVQTVSFAYGEKPAVEDVNCEIKEGSITGIIGHNGSGKSTLGKMIAGILRPSTGTIDVGDGIQPHQLSAEQAIRKVGLLPQTTKGMFFTPTVKQELAYTPNAIGDEPTVTAEMIGLEGLEEQLPDFLSTGQAQKLGIGCALSSDAEIIVFDEPTKGLNQEERINLVQQLLRLQSEGKTIILISHDWPMVARAANEVLVMDHGKLVREGPAIEVLQDRDFFEQLGLPLPW